MACPVRSYEGNVRVKGLGTLSAVNCNINIYCVFKLMRYSKHLQFFKKSFFLFILPCALTDILGKLAQRLLVQDSKKGRIIVQRYKSIKVKDKTDDRL